MKHSASLALLFLIGIVDRVGDMYITAEITTDEDRSVTIELPIDLLPCDVVEGDMFYFEHVDGVTEIRCGEPE